MTRADCANGPRPCPWVSCAHHLLLDVHAENERVPPTIRLNGRNVLGLRRGAPAPLVEAFFDEAIERLSQLEHSCSLDAADEGPRSYRQVGRLLGVVKQRVVQEATAAQQKLRAKAGKGRDFDDEESRTYTRAREVRQVPK